MAGETYSGRAYLEEVREKWYSMPPCARKGEPSVGVGVRATSGPWLAMRPRFCRFRRVDVGVVETTTAETGRLMTVPKYVALSVTGAVGGEKRAPTSHPVARSDWSCGLAWVVSCPT